MLVLGSTEWLSLCVQVSLSVTGLSGHPHSWGWSWCGEELRLLRGDRSQQHLGVREWSKLILKTEAADTRQVSAVVFESLWKSWLWLSWLVVVVSLYWFALKWCMPYTSNPSCNPVTEEVNYFCKVHVLSIQKQEACTLTRGVSFIIQNFMSFKILLYIPWSPLYQLWISHLFLLLQSQHPWQRPEPSGWMWSGWLCKSGCGGLLFIWCTQRLRHPRPLRASSQHLTCVTGQSQIIVGFVCFSSGSRLH